MFTNSKSEKEMKKELGFWLRSSETEGVIQIWIDGEKKDQMDYFSIPEDLQEIISTMMNVSYILGSIDQSKSNFNKFLN